MSHKEQIDYCKSVRELHPAYFENKKVLDVGSLDINGNNQYLFQYCKYHGLDVGEGKNVQIICPVHLYTPNFTYDVIISTECFEHDKHYRESLLNIVSLLKSGGLFLMTCATTGRPEHGTKRTSPDDAPLIEWNDYYKNLTEEDFRAVLNMDEIFSSYKFSVDITHKDLQLWAIKK
jgi:SAM-dependent methyltransferase